MTQLCPAVPLQFTSASNQDIIFQNKNDSQVIKGLESKEQPKYGRPGESCKYNLFLGFFFDGTRNNYMACEPSDAQAREADLKNKDKKKRYTPNCHSNIARLYDCYPGRSVPGVLSSETDWAYKPEMYQHFFKTYIPGVGTEFKQIGDTGEGLWDGTMGAAAANNGSARLVWGLIQAINCVHRFFKKNELLITASEANTLSKRVTLSAASLKQMTDPDSNVANGGVRSDSDPHQGARRTFESLIGRLNEAVRHHRIEPGANRPSQLDPGIVQGICISVFGFSRGATKARVFANWLLALGELDAQITGQQGHTLGGIPFKIDFMGLFDTVASVGVANSFGDALFGRWLDGHAGWADAEHSLRVPTEVPCLHMVSAHEVRRSFPLDSISVNGRLDRLHREIVFPGVHSDIGGGYAPGEQGKGLAADGQDMMSRIPLIMMYREARLAGVPFKLELASTKTKERFALAASTIEDFNAYLDACHVGKPAIDDSKPAALLASLTDIYREQRMLYIRWRQRRRHPLSEPLEKTESFSRASTFDQNDLRSANLELEEEIEAFEKWLKAKGTSFTPEAQKAGFNNTHVNEWEEIARWWHDSHDLSPAVARFFDNYVHDSRAWFKLMPGNPDSEADMVKMVQGWAIRAKYELHSHAHRGLSASRPRLTDEQRRAASEFERTKQLPRMLTQGREPFFLGNAGYLRYRKIYGGGDAFLLSHNTPLPAADAEPRVLASAGKSASPDLKHQTVDA